MTRLRSLFERTVVGFAHASAATGLFLAFALGSLVVFLGGGGDVVLALIGPRSTVWWLGAIGVWIALSGIVAVALARRDASAVDGRRRERRR